jgi:hypothetical protein
MPTRRNATLTMALPVVVAFAGLELTDVFAPSLFPLAAAGWIVAGVVLHLFTMARMIRELRAVTENPGFAWWPAFIPIYGLYWRAVVLQAEVAKAKAMRGASEARDSFVYACLGMRALAEDLNDLAD